MKNSLQKMKDENDSSLKHSQRFSLYREREPDRKFNRHQKKAKFIGRIRPSKTRGRYRCTVKKQYS